MTHTADPTTFRKRVYTLPRFGADLLTVVRRRGAVVRPWRPNSVDPLLREQMMFAVAMVNDCKFCAYVHDAAAIAEGADRASLARLVGLDPDQADDDRLLTILWAQSRTHAALGPADDALEAAMRQRYTAAELLDLDTVVRVMTLANIAGNTAEALLRRLRGHTVPGSRLGDEVTIGGGYLLGSVVPAARTAAQRRVSPRRILREFRAFDGAASAR
ncbi:carboxymuconolactone decarboxylase family protein [Nocardia sp. NPDC058176]|uniref:carboxymuconolactone decarboxylase family protein n=1 Tax=Nocardia sp. NPDC058176 TaxID=3346368 RepID=UPI0036DB00F7